MKTVHLSLLSVFVSLALLLTACEDATNVGADLVGAQGGQPVTEDVPLNDLRTTPLERPDNIRSRLIAGQVDDPLLGNYRVEGYSDITAVTSADFRAEAVDSVELRLVPTYVYGDTTSEVTLAVRDITEAWSPNDVPTDTSFSVGPVVREFTFVPTDTLVVVPLPESWITEHEDAFASPDIGSLIHGFRFDPVAGNAVVGFDPSTSSLYAETSNESSTSPLATSYPSVEHATEPDLPPNTILMQAGAGPHLTFEVPIESLEASAVNRTAITLWADTLTLNQSLPAHFVRPILRTVDLFGITADETPVLLGRTTINDDGQYVFDSPSLARAVQNDLLDQLDYERFELRIPDPNTLTGASGDVLYYYTSINPVILFDTHAAERAPAAFLTLTPLD